MAAARCSSTFWKCTSPELDAQLVSERLRFNWKSVASARDRKSVTRRSGSAQRIKVRVSGVNGNESRARNGIPGRRRSTRCARTLIRFTEARTTSGGLA